MLPNAAAPTPGAESTRPFATIQFEDHGQDFLEWDCAEDGAVIACRPFQEWLWCQGRVTNLGSLGPGDQVDFESGHSGYIVINYPVVSVIKWGELNV